MIKVSDVVQQILLEDGFALESMQRGLLNMRAYAKEIHAVVEEKTKKQVSIGTIVVSLLRLKSKLSKISEFSPVVAYTHLSITSDLTAVTFARTQEMENELQNLATDLVAPRNFFTVTEGLHEITIICDRELVPVIKKHFLPQPKVELKKLVGISVRIPELYIDVPNTLYSLLGALAVRQINVMEIVSTYTELTFVIVEEEMELAVQALQRYLRKHKQLESE